MIIHAEGRFEAIRFRVESMRRGELLPEDNFYPDLQKAIDEDTLPKDGRKEDDYHPPGGSMKLITADELREIADGIDNQNHAAEAYQAAITVALDNMTGWDVLQALEKIRGDE